jgi:hypothetical protein
MINEQHTCTYMYVIPEIWIYITIAKLGRRGRDRMVVGLTITCAISTYQH